MSRGESKAQFIASFSSVRDAYSTLLWLAMVTLLNLPKIFLQTILTIIRVLRPHFKGRDNACGARRHERGADF